MIDFFLENSELNDRSVIELGTHYGYTTKVLSYLFREVITFDNSYQMTSMARAFNQERDNIVYFTEDVYNYDWWPTSEAIGAVWRWESAYRDAGYLCKTWQTKNTRDYKDGAFGNLTGIEENYTDENELIASHFGRGSSGGSPKYLKSWNLPWYL